MGRKFTYVLVGVSIALFFLVLMAKNKSSNAEYDQAACAGPPLKGVKARNDAMEAGYSINPRYDCIDKESFVAINQQKAAWEIAQKEARAAKANPPPPSREPTLAEARKGFQTAISLPVVNPKPFPIPPAELFVPIAYRNPRNQIMTAFITPDPKDALKYPAIIWLTGGDTNSLDDFWTPGPESNDQSARAFREAGMIMMFPTLRGGNLNGGGKEYFYGEVDDVLAAADVLALQPYVDAKQIYLGGMSTGGTLALLTAEMSGRFKAVFAFGPAADVHLYPPSLVPVNFLQHDPRELKLRSPVHWVSGISSPTYVIEGKNAPSNISDLEAICNKSTNPQLHCIAADGLNHFSVNAKVTRVIAARLAVSASGIEFKLKPEEFQNK